ncbi:stage II sporulation protein R [bacterium BFN5]|nr:stage II sporulation protein R [bacterium BFN5]
MRRNLLVPVSILFALVLLGWTFLFEQIKQNAPVSFEQEGLIRFHVLANSDKPEDQQLKLKVRDAVIAYLAPQLEHLTDPEDARQVVVENEGKLIDIAQHVIVENGANYPVSIEFGVFDFPVKSYGNFVLPAGKYEAVRILIGNAEGKNWWCVLFPPLCFIDITNAAAVPTDNVNVISESENVNKNIEIKWKVAEVWDLINDR